MRYRTLLANFTLILVLQGLAQSAVAGPTIAAPFATDYSLTDLGLPKNPPFAGVGFLSMAFQADNPNVLLGGINGNHPGDTRDGIYSVGVQRGAGNHITGFSTAEAFFASAPYIDGGLAYAPNGVLLYSARIDNYSIGELKPGSKSADKVVGIGGSLDLFTNGGSLGFVPAKYPGAGAFQISDYTSAGIYTASLVGDHSGTYNVENIKSQTYLAGMPQTLGQFSFVPLGSRDFNQPSMLYATYKNSDITAYTLDSNGVPISSSRQPFITGANLPFAAVEDPITGDLLFSDSASGGDSIYVVSGFAAPSTVPEPTSLTLAALGAAAIVCRVGKHSNSIRSF